MLMLVVARGLREAADLSDRCKVNRRHERVEEIMKLVVKYLWIQRYTAI